MCPACIATAALAIAGATSTGGQVALVAMGLPAMTGARGDEPTARTMEREKLCGEIAAPRGKENAR